jgi:excisionase family DNA binding protein
VERYAGAIRSLPVASGANHGEGETEVLYDKKQAAEYLSTTERHIDRLWQEHRLGGTLIGRKVRFRQNDLDKYIEAQSRPARRSA